MHSPLLSVGIGNTVNLATMFSYPDLSGPTETNWIQLHATDHDRFQLVHLNWSRSGNME